MQQTTAKGSQTARPETSQANALRRFVRASRGADAVPLSGRVDPRRMTPHQLAAWAEELYADGMMSWQEYALAGFPAELHPDFKRTVGALTGDRAQPDRPRDMIAIWEERHNRELRLLGTGSTGARCSGRIVDLLRWQESSLLVAHAA